ncbi:MAG: periplasmic protein TonB [Sphingomonadales bacterium]|jgi:protein TonB|nr:periplasmic protein TonB [Sphingomonadales bacterium]MEA3036269.1 periplasmic protein TonB [Sphingomonadales bacterium]
MAYADNKMSTGRITAIVIVAILHAILGYAFVTGLAYNVVKKVAADLKTFNVDEPPPPDEKPPPPPPDQPNTPPPIVAPPPIVRTNTMPPPISVVQNAPPVIITPTAPTAPPAPPAPPPPPPPPVKVEPARAKANLSSLFSDEDYPASALRNNESGTTGFRLQVGPNGRVTGCQVTSSSGSSALDAATCRLLTSRARFNPARDSSGQPTSDSVSNRIVWRIPAD